MPQRPPIDILPLKDAARGLRAAARRGMAALHDSLPLTDLPDPAKHLADQALGQARALGAIADRGLSGLAHALFDPPHDPINLGDMQTDAEAVFAAALYQALQQVLDHMGSAETGISETAARAAWRRVQQHRGAESDNLAAAELLLALEEVGLILPQTATNTPDLRPALFAALLAMLAAPEDATPLLPAASDLAHALAHELSQAADAPALAALFKEFRHHV